MVSQIGFKAVVDPAYPLGLSAVLGDLARRVAEVEQSTDLDLSTARIEFVPENFGLRSLRIAVNTRDR